VERVAVRARGHHFFIPGTLKRVKDLNEWTRAHISSRAEVAFALHDVHGLVSTNEQHRFPDNSISATDAGRDQRQLVCLPAPSFTERPVRRDQVWARRAIPSHPSISAIARQTSSPSIRSSCDRLADNCPANSCYLVPNRQEQNHSRTEDRQVLTGNFHPSFSTSRDCALLLQPPRTRLFPRNRLGV
jgi:hypothetical protein